MKDYQSQFLDVAIASDALRFGEFTLKSGRVSPYFFNTGLFNSGHLLGRLGEFYARAIVDWGIAVDGLFGPAYKGIPLACATAVALSALTDRPVPYSFNRKELKSHGEGGRVVGAPLAGSIMIVDDVISSGLSIAESVDVIRASGAEPIAALVALDRQERGEQTARSAIDETRARHGIEVRAIVTLTHILDYLERHPTLHIHVTRILAYREQYGTRG